MLVNITQIKILKWLGVCVNGLVDLAALDQIDVYLTECRVKVSFRDGALLRNRLLLKSTVRKMFVIVDHV